MKEKHAILIIAFSLTFSACGNNYMDPLKINIDDYTPAVNEIKSKRKLRDSLFEADNPNIQFRVINLRNFNDNKALINIFPECYKLLKAYKATEIDCYYDSCMNVILKEYESAFVPRNIYECLKIQSGDVCDSNKNVVKEHKLKNGWKYQLIDQYGE